jgi:hypothetical protein
MSLRLLSLLLIAVLAAGCGGSDALGRKALQQEGKGIHSLAAEGSLLAGNAAKGRTTVVFTRIHAQALRASARSSASTLAGGRTAEAWRLASLAVRLGVELDRLSRSGANRVEQQRLERSLAAIAAKTA